MSIYKPAGILYSTLLFIATVHIAWAGVCLFTKYPVNGLPVNVTLVVNNVIENPTFKSSQAISLPQTYLISVVSAAADVNKVFQYSAQYYSNLGLMITAINNVFANQQKRTYWEFIDAKTFKPLECGVSTFVPINEDVILFNLTTY
ncbi:gastric intrinsic factor-like isoform X1 [Biomphalaria pfeifferi]|uniref:Gastric intrinsic factor-like isoform X1 n=1 Tax=Biomphalaria pfeifferi TaxID=112525 RepID=A0AAD8B315_BIOPF|nr:gastric intrinsic factor-like isoform X1 [Biomphalaria pfeifferi]